MRVAAILLASLVLASCNRAAPEAPCARIATAAGRPAVIHVQPVKPPALTPTEPNYVRPSADEGHEFDPACDDGSDNCGAADGHDSDRSTQTEGAE